VLTVEPDQIRDIELVNQAWVLQGRANVVIGTIIARILSSYRARWQHIRAEASHIVALGSHDDAGHVCDAPPRCEESVLRSLLTSSRSKVAWMSSG